ncbi:MAG: hypothetical protein WCW87_01395 [Candidatus Paceibacterota bacterium]
MTSYTFLTWFPVAIIFYVWFAVTRCITHKKYGEALLQIAVIFIADGIIYFFELFSQRPSVVPFLTSMGIIMVVFVAIFKALDIASEHHSKNEHTTKK